MIEQSKLLECMEEIKSIAMSQQGRLTREEIQKYLSDMELDRKQMEAVCQYLAASQIVIEGYDPIPQETFGNKEAESAVEEKQRENEKIQESDGKLEDNVSGKKLTKAQRNLQIYQREVSALVENTQEQERELMKRFLKGDSQIRNEVVQGYLGYVLEIAGDYKKRNVLLEEIIAEGNMGLLNAMGVLEQGRESFLAENGQPDMERIHSVIEMEIRQAMEMLIDDMTEKKDWEDTILAKINLLHEAAKYLAEEMGRTATQEELSEYTKIPIEEIRDITDLSKDAKKVII